MKQEFTHPNEGVAESTASYVVDRLQPGRTVAPHGITGPELDRLNDAVRFMQLHCQKRRSDLWWLTTNKNTDRDTIAAIWKRITRLQREAGLPTYSAIVFETGGGLHANVVFISNTAIIESLRQSEAFCQALNNEKAIQRAYDPLGLVRRYLVKERTPQAGYRRWQELGGRIKKSHRLPGGGDRVRLSEDLERDAIAAGFVSRWRHTYARRSDTRKSYSPRATQRLGKTAPRPAHQLLLLPELGRPVARLKDFGGGFLTGPVVMEIEFHRKRLGLSERELGNLAGISQGHYANVIRGHDPISAAAIRRLRQVLAQTLISP